jgi:hypothetical protein
VSLDDPRGDVAGPDYIDVVGLDARRDGDDVTFVLELAGSPPTGRSALEEEINYLFLVGTGGDSSDDLWLTLTNNQAGEWLRELTDFDPPGTTRGLIEPFGTSIQGRVPLAGIGTPASTERGLAGEEGFEPSIS